MARARPSWPKPSSPPAEASNFKFLYPLEWSIKQKIEHIARIYGAAAVGTASLLKQIANYERNGFGNLPICMAKTHLSLSHDPDQGAPTGFTLPIREVRASVGAAPSTRSSAR